MEENNGNLKANGTPRLDLEDVLDFNQEKDRTGILYISRVPPMMGPQEIRNYLCPFGPINRVYMTPADKGKKTTNTSNSSTSKKRGMFIDGWVEFKRKKDAKNAALALNGTTVGGKRTSKYYGEMWALKYLSSFKWSNLTEQIELEKATRQQKLLAEIGQAKREAGFYLKQVEKAETAGKIEAKRAAKRAAEAGQVASSESPVVDQDAVLDGLKKRFRQRKPIMKK